MRPSSTGFVASMFDYRLCPSLSCDVTHGGHVTVISTPPGQAKPGHPAEWDARAGIEGLRCKAAAGQRHPRRGGDGPGETGTEEESGNRRR